MVMINRATKEMTIKIVYYGPGLCGKTTNLEYIFEKANPQKKGKLLSVATETDRTLFFDFLPMELGTIKGMRLRVQLYTVPGQVFYDATRRIVLRGSDGVVFVADSQNAMMEANRESLENLKKNLRLNNLDPETIPIVLQYNKQDLQGLSTDEELERALNWRGVPHYRSVATVGTGVNETLKKAIELVIRSLHQKEAVLKRPGQAVQEPRTPENIPRPSTEAVPTAEVPAETAPPPIPPPPPDPPPALEPPPPPKEFEFSRKGEFEVESADQEPGSVSAGLAVGESAPAAGEDVEVTAVENEIVEIEAEEPEAVESTLVSAEAADGSGPEPEVDPPAEEPESTGSLPAEVDLEDVELEELPPETMEPPFGGSESAPQAEPAPSIEEEAPLPADPSPEFADPVELPPASVILGQLASYRADIEEALARLRSLAGDLESLMVRIGNLEERLRP